MPTLANGRLFTPQNGNKSYQPKHDSHRETRSESFAREQPLQPETRDRAAKNIDFAACIGEGGGGQHGATYGIRLAFGDSAAIFRFGTSQEGKGTGNYLRASSLGQISNTVDNTLLPGENDANLRLYLLFLLCIHNCDTVLARGLTLDNRLAVSMLGSFIGIQTCTNS